MKNQHRTELLASTPHLRRSSASPVENAAPAKTRISSDSEALDAAIEVAILQAQNYLLSAQTTDGSWEGALECGVSPTAWTLLLHERLGVHEPEVRASLATYVRHRQLADGGWSAGADTSADLSATLEAYWALLISGDACDAPHMVSAAERIDDLWETGEFRLMTRVLLATFGFVPWSSLPCIPPETVLVPKLGTLDRAPYAWSDAALALSILGGKNVALKMPPWADLSHLLSHQNRGELLAQRPYEPESSVYSQVMQTADRLLHWFESKPLKPLRGLALTKAGERLIASQSREGGWHNLTSTVLALLALHSLGYSTLDAVVANGVNYLSHLQSKLPGGERWQQTHATLNTDTVGAALALSRTDREVFPDRTTRRSVRAAVRSLLTRRGAAAATDPDRALAAWGWSSASNAVDFETTSRVIQLLSHQPKNSRLRTAATTAAVNRAIAALLEAQEDDGSWRRFSFRSNGRLIEAHPLSDVAHLKRAGSDETTAHALFALCTAGAVHSEPVHRASEYLLRRQREDGSWIGRWTGAIGGTSIAVQALIASGLSRNSEPMRAARQFLLDSQHPSGAWGENPERTVREELFAPGMDDSVPTAWSLTALTLLEGTQSLAERRALRWLLQNQEENGYWAIASGSRLSFQPMSAVAHHLDAVIEPLLALCNVRFARKVSRAQG